MFNFDENNAAAAGVAAIDEEFKRRAEAMRPDPGPFHRFPRGDQDLIALHSLSVEIIERMIEASEGTYADSVPYKAAIRLAASKAGELMSALSVVLGTLCGFVQASSPHLVHANPVDLAMSLCKLALHDGAATTHENPEDKAEAAASTLKDMIEAQMLVKGALYIRAAGAIAANGQAFEE